MRQTVNFFVESLLTGDLWLIPALKRAGARGHCLPNDVGGPLFFVFPEKGRGVDKPLPDADRRAIRENRAWTVKTRTGALMKKVIDLTADLIRFKTTSSRPAELGRCADFIEAYLKRHGCPYERFDRGEVPSILAGPPSRKMPVLLMSHFDVVEAPDALFEPREVDGRLFGRGSIDDKYAVALSLVLLDEALQRLRARGGGAGDLPFGILMTGDEETGGKQGAKPLLAEIDTDFCIALDGGGLDKVVVKEKGIVHLKLTTPGKAAHSSRPWLGENAIDGLIEDYLKLKARFGENAADLWQRTLNFSRIQGGKAINQVPDEAEALFDIRYTENDDINRLVAEIQPRLRGRLSIERKEPLFMGGDSPFLDLLLELSPQTKTGFEHGASDARFLADTGTAGIVWGAEGDKSAHTSEEHLNIESVGRLYAVLDEFLKKVGEKTSAGGAR
jgi:succinyl-diaminopimelate desuccinylase